MQLLIEDVPKLARFPCYWICPLGKYFSWGYLWSCRIIFFSPSSSKNKKHLPPAVDQNEAPTNLKWPQREKDFWWLWKMMVKEFVLFNDATNTIKDQFNSISTRATDDTGKRFTVQKRTFRLMKKKMFCKRNHPFSWTKASKGKIQFLLF